LIGATHLAALWRFKSGTDMKRTGRVVRRPSLRNVVRRRPQRKRT